VLSAIAVRVSVAEDHFVKVRGLIKDLIQKLKDDAAAEATQKSFCDKSMAKAISDRDEAQANREVALGRLTTLNAKKEKLEDEIKDLEKAISELKKALLEATELRAEEKAENEKTIEMATEGKDAVKLALPFFKTSTTMHFCRSASMCHQSLTAMETPWVISHLRSSRRNTMEHRPRRQVSLAFWK
jgi:predicted RNase H-like nuclease (RuvC/YqgF family)